MSNLIPMDEAASMLGMTVEQLTELRSNNEIFGYKDGANWKFKQTELERVAGELNITLKPASAPYEEDSSVELDLPASELSGSIKLEESGEVLDDELSFGSSSLSLASESSKSAGDSANLLDDDPEKADSPSDTGKMLGAGNEDDLLLSEDDLFSDELSLADSTSFEESAELDSDFEESDLILDDSDSNSEIMLDSSASGIGLGDEPLELGGSDIDSLELPEDDDMIVLDSAADSEAATMMQEDDFNLTPLEASMDEDDSSGSQVIALEDSEIYAEDSASSGLEDSEAFPAQPMMVDDGGFDSGMQYPDGGMMPAAVGPAALPEAPYTIWQVLSLGLVAFLLVTGGMIAYGLIQNLGLPNDEVVNGSVMNFFLGLVGQNG
ncbi:MAG: hypothetical protein ACPHO8_00240 [Mariniblastus sp.]|jgi:hypothetical protein